MFIYCIFHCFKGFHAQIITFENFSRDALQTFSLTTGDSVSQWKFEALQNLQGVTE